MRPLPTRSAEADSARDVTWCTHTSHIPTRCWPYSATPTCRQIIQLPQRVRELPADLDQHKAQILTAKCAAQCTALTRNANFAQAVHLHANPVQAHGAWQAHAHSESPRTTNNQESLPIPACSLLTNSISTSLNTMRATHCMHNAAACNPRPQLHNNITEQVCAIWAAVCSQSPNKYSASATLQGLQALQKPIVHSYDALPCTDMVCAQLPQTKKTEGDAVALSELLAFPLMKRTQKGGLQVLHRPHTLLAGHVNHTIVSIAANAAVPAGCESTRLHLLPDPASSHDMPQHKEPTQPCCRQPPSH
jgi:hypothetical protein